MLSLHDFSVSVSGKHIIEHIDFDFAPGSIYAVLGENGSGKSSLAFGLFGHPKYVTSGQRSYRDQDLVVLTPDKLIESGLFLSFQNVPEIPGIRLIEYLRTIYTRYFERMHPGEKVPSGFVFRRMIEKLLPEYGIEPSFLDRDLYVGFSGGEKRRIEMLQIALLEPSCILLDEIDAGLDIGAIELLSKKIDTWRNE